MNLSSDNSNEKLLTKLEKYLYILGTLHLEYGFFVKEELDKKLVIKLVVMFLFILFSFNKKSRSGSNNQTLELEIFLDKFEFYEFS